MKTARIVSTGSYLPGEPLSNADMERLAGPVPDDILEGIQVKQRHWLIDPETGAHLESNSDLASKAAQEALELGGVDASEVDLIVLSTASPEYHLPPLVTFVQEQLGLRALRDRRDPVRLLRRRRGTRRRPDVSRAGRVRHRARDRQRGDLALFVYPIFRGKDPGVDPDARPVVVYSFGDGARRDRCCGRPTTARAGFLGSAMACVGGEQEAGHAGDWRRVRTRPCTSSWPRSASSSCAST